MNVPNMINRKVNNALQDQIKKLVEQEYQFIAGERVQDMFAADIVDLVNHCYKQSWQLDVGQIVWYGAAIDEKPGYGKNSRKTILRPVVLTLVSSADLTMAEQGYSHREIRKYKAVRLFKEARDQQALLTNSDVGFLLHVSAGTISKDIQEYMKEHNEIIPTRGIVHDIGRAVTHKKIIIRYYNQGYQTPEIARKTDHTIEACDRYIKAYRRVKKLSENMNPAQISQTLGMGTSLVKEYIALIEHEEAS